MYTGERNQKRETRNYLASGDYSGLVRETSRMVAEIGADNIGRAFDSVRNRLLERSGMVVSRAFLAACGGSASRRTVECLRHLKLTDFFSISADGEKPVAGGDSSGISSVVARLHR